MGQLFSVRRLKANWQNYKETGTIYTLEKSVHMFCTVNIEPKERTKQTNRQM